MRKIGVSTVLLFAGALVCLLASGVTTAYGSLSAWLVGGSVELALLGVFSVALHAEADPG
jgi:hypothetical protein